MEGFPDRTGGIEPKAQASWVPYITSVVPEVHLKNETSRKRCRPRIEQPLKPPRMLGCEVHMEHIRRDEDMTRVPCDKCARLGARSMRGRIRAGVQCAGVGVSAEPEGLFTKWSEGSKR